MTLTELRYIVAVGRERHFGRAAESCFVSQPTLSVAIRKLEEELDVVLFERGKGEVLVTPIGEAIITRAEQVLRAVEGIREAAAHHEGDLAMPLRMGAIFTIAPYLLPEIIPILRDSAPDMPLLIEENYTHVLSEHLRKGELDVIVISLPFQEPGIETEPLYEEPFVILMPASHPWTQQEAIPAAQMADENILLLGPGHCFRDQVLELCPECAQTGGSSALRGMVGSSLETIRHMVASGLGVTVLPCSSAGAEKYSRRLVTIRRFVEPEPRRVVALAWRRGFTRPGAIDAVKHAIWHSGLTCVRMLGTGA